MEKDHCGKKEKKEKGKKTSIFIVNKRLKKLKSSF